MLADLVAQPLGGDDGDLVTYSLVGLEIKGEFGVVALDDDLGRLLHRLKCDFVSELQSHVWVMSL